MGSPFLRRPGGLGERFSGAFRAIQMVGDLLEASLVGTDFTLLFIGLNQVGTFTVYDAIIQELGPCILSMDALSRVIPYEGPYADFSVKEVCAGIGGIGTGARALGAQVVAVLDCNELACSHLILNLDGNSSALCRDLCDDSAKGDLHIAGGRSASILTAGFPCQPHSTQGSRGGFRDPRHKVFIEVLRTAYLHMVDCLVLECTPQAQYDHGVRTGLDLLAEVMGWQIHETTLVLSHQWPCRRHRWWAILCPADWHTTTLTKWPEDRSHQQVGTVVTRWRCWPESHEYDLQLTETEYAAYNSPHFGDDQRLLTAADMAPTFLHSYGCALQACPCQCRDMAFSEETLRTRGLRGCYVISQFLSTPRFLHPMELAALLGFPATMSHLSSMRGMLCLLGAVASPLQSLWVFACLRSMMHGSNAADTQAFALQALQEYKIHLLQGYDHLWGSTSAVPRPLRLCTSDQVDIIIMVCGLVTVAEILSADAFAHAPGAQQSLCDGSRSLPPGQFLLQHGAHGPYHLCMIHPGQAVTPAQVVVGIEHASHLHVTFLPLGGFLFEALQSCGISAVQYLFDRLGHCYGLDYRVQGSLRLTTQPHPDDGTTMAYGLSWPAALGLNAEMVWFYMNSLLARHVGLTKSWLVLPPLCASSSQQFPFLHQHCSMEFFALPCPTLVLCICAVDQHWILLTGLWHGSGRIWTCFDGLQPLAGSAMVNWVRSFARSLAMTLQESFEGLRCASWICQFHSHTCGSVALGHLLCLLGWVGIWTPQLELAFHQSLLDQQAGGSFMAFGRSASELVEQLATLLLDKGVPDADVQQRAQDVLQTLGHAAVTEALGTSNPWATLKGLASRPSTRMRLVKEHELRAHINQQATKKHGAHIPRAKQKKQTSQSSSLPPVDPGTLQLVPNTFVDDDGDAIPQIPFHEVSKDAHGIAFCTHRQAQPFIDAQDNISSTTLGLLITTEVPLSIGQMTNLTSMRFPALCLATDEPLLIQGSLLTLSDGAIHRHEVDTPELSVYSTDIVKVQIHKDEINMDWQQVVRGPIRALLQLSPLFRLCSGKQCGADCPLYHPPLDEELPGLILDIWARNFCNLNGKTTKADLAAYFQVLLRIPSVALDHVLRINVPGVYVEPRASQERGPHPDYCVIWLPGLSLEQAMHKLRTCDHGLSLAKMNHRYGVRVRALHEQATHQALRPDEEYVAVQIKQVYTIFPLPHGLSRQQVSKLLTAWGWRAKPLQTTKGTNQGQGWSVGSDNPPPSKVMRGFDRDLLITLQKDTSSSSSTASVVASQRTKRFLKEGALQSTNEDPWHNGADPWANHRPTTAATPSTSAPARRLEQLQAAIREEVQQQVQQAPPGLSPSLTPPDSVIQQLQVNITELQAQGGQFQQWFHEAGQRMSANEQQLQHLHTVVEQQGQHVAKQIDMIQQEVDNKTQILQSSLQGSLAAMQRDFDVSLDTKLSNRFDLDSIVLNRCWPRSPALRPD